MMTEDEVRILADRIATSNLGRWGFQSSDVKPGQDHYGDDALFVTLHFKSGSSIADGSDYTDVLIELLDALRDEGDQRFPYLNYEYVDDERPFSEAEDHLS